jgi:hypothetical protein
MGHIKVETYLDGLIHSAVYSDRGEVVRWLRFIRKHDANHPEYERLVQGFKEKYIQAARKTLKQEILWQPTDYRYRKGKERTAMAKYTVTITERYSVEADSAEQALASYRVGFEDIEPVAVGIDPANVISPDEFEFLGDSGTAEEDN